MKSLNPNSLGKKYIVEQCQKICMKTFLRTTRQKLKVAILQAEVSVTGVQVNLTASKINNGGVRYWFACPLCNGRVGVLYIHPISNQLGCRKCLDLKYKKSQYKGMVENSTD